MSETKSSKYKFLSELFKGLGFTILGLTTIGGFFAYSLISNWGEFREELETQEFMVVDPETVKLNPFFAFPLLIGVIVFLIIMWRKNKEFLKGKLSFGLVVTIAIIYFIYSIAVVTLATLVGSFVGSMIYEFIFNPLSVKNAKKVVQIEFDNHEYDMERHKEEIRIAARKAAREELDGSV